jgi:hypothetical protein
MSKYVKKECFEGLKDFGFYDMGNCYGLKPGPPMSVINVFADKKDGRFWCGFYTYDAFRSFDNLLGAGMIED